MRAFAIAEGSSQEIFQKIFEITHCSHLNIPDLKEEWVQGNPTERVVGPFVSPIIYYVKAELLRKSG